MRQKTTKRLIKVLGFASLLSIALVGTFVFAEVTQSDAPPEAKQAELSQGSYRFFSGDATLLTEKPSAKQNIKIDLPKPGAFFKLKVLLGVSNGDLNQDEVNFKLQYAEKVGECDAGFSGEDYSDVTSDSAISFVKSSALSDGDLLSATKYDPTNKGTTIRNQSFEEENGFSNNISKIAVGESGKWEFSLKDSGARTSTSYCFRVVKQNGDLLSSYSNIPEVTTQIPVLVDLVDSQVGNNKDVKDLSPSIVIVDTQGVITKEGGLRLSFAGSSLNSAWNQTDSQVEFGGNAKRKVGTDFTYEDGGKTLVIPVKDDFEIGDSLVITGLRFVNLSNVGNVEMSKKDFVIKNGSPYVYLEVTEAEIVDQTTQEVYVDEYSKDELDKIPTYKVDAGEFFLKSKKEFKNDEDVSFTVSDNINLVKDDTTLPASDTSIINQGADLVKNISNTVKATPKEEKEIEKGNLPSSGSLDIVAIEVLDTYDLPTNLEAKVVSDPVENKIEVIKPSDSFRPGVYKLKTTVVKDGIAYEVEQTFAWGVLALNTDKDRYEVGDNAYLQFASLNEYGHTLCDTNLKLTITKPDGSTVILSTGNAGISYSANTCGHNNYTSDPDYYSHYSFSESGRYLLHLENTGNGYSIDEQINVSSKDEFEIERKSATRTNPFLNRAYTMGLLVHSQRDFDARITETLPEGFLVAESLDADFETNVNPDGTTNIIWDKHVSANEPLALSYDYYGPQISPEFFNLGPLVISEYKEGIPTEVYKEESSWQIASDAACVSAAVTGNWSNETTWTDASCGALHYPGQSGATADTATITLAAVVTADTTTTIAGLTICASTCGTATSLTHNSAIGLTINGAVTLNQGSSAVTSAWNINAGYATTSTTVSIAGTQTNSSRIGQITLTTGKWTSNGNIDMGSTGTVSKIIDTSGGAGRIDFYGTPTNFANGVLNSGTGGNIFNYASTTLAQTVTHFGQSGSEYNNLYINNTGGVGATLGADITTTNVTGDLKVQSGTFANGGFVITGTSGKIFNVASNAIFTMTGGTTAVFPTGFTTYTLDTASTVNYNQDSAQTVSAQTYGILNITPTLTAARIYTGTAITANGNFTINPTAGSTNKGLLFNMGGTLTVAATATTTISGAGAGPATSSVDIRPVSTDYNISSGHLDIQTNGTLDGAGAASTITLTGTDTGGILLTRAGTFTAGSTEVIMNPAADVTLTSGTFTSTNALNKLTISPTITGAQIYTFGSGAITTGAAFLINPSSTGANLLTVNMGADITVPATATTTITGAGAGPATSKLDIRPASTDYNISTGHLDVQANGTLDGTSAASTITLTGTAVGGVMFTRTGTFTAGNTEVIMNPNILAVKLTVGTFIGSNAFYKLTLSPADEIPVSIYTFGAGVASTTGDFTINPSSASSRQLSVGMQADIDVASTATTTIKGTNTATVVLDTRPASTDYNLSTGHLDIQSAGTLDASSAASTITLTGSDTGGILFTRTGTFTAGNSTVIMNPNASVNLTSGTFIGSNAFYKLTLSPTVNSTDKTYTFGSSIASTTNNFLINPSVQSGLYLNVNMGADIDVAATATTTITQSGSGITRLDTRPSSTDYNLATGHLDIQSNAVLDAASSASTITLKGTDSGGVLFTRSGTFTAGNSTVLMNPDQNVTLTSGTFTNGNSFYKLTLSPAITSTGKTYTFGSGNASTTGDFTISPTATSLDLTVNMGADLTVATTATTTIDATGAGATATLDTRPASTDYNLTTGHLNVAAKGTLDATSASSVINLNAVEGILFTQSGTFKQGTSDVEVTSASGSPTLLSAATTFHKLTINSAATLISAGAAITMSSVDSSNALTITSGVLDDGGNQIVGTSNGTIVAGSTGTLKLGSAGTATVFPTNYVAIGITLDPASTVVFNAGTSQNISATPTYGGLQLSKPSGTPTKTALSSLVIVGNLTIDSGNTLLTTSNITLKGNYTNNGTFTTSANFTLNGTSQQTISGTMTGGSAFSTLTLSNSTGTNPSDCEVTSYVPSVIFSGGVSATNFTILTANSRIQYKSGATYTFTNINWNANPIYFRNSTASGSWNLNVSGTQTAVSYVNVSRSDASSGSSITANDGTNTDCNNNTNWTFPASNTAPVISNMKLNNGVDITPTESTYTWATSTFLITDSQYCSTISSVTAKMYLASTTPNYGTLCSANDLNCYLTAQACTATTTGNTCGGSDTTVEYDCGFKVWYIARATDSTSPWATSIWSAAATATDSGALTGTATSSTPSAGIEVNSLRAIDTTVAIAYGSLAPNSNTGATNQTVRVTDTGNVDSDLEVSGTSMTCSLCSILTPIVASMQQYLISTFTYGGGTALSGTPTNFDINLLAPTATTSSSYIDTYWGLGPPGGTAAGSYTGTNTFTPIAPF